MFIMPANGHCCFRVKKVDTQWFCNVHTQAAAVDSFDPKHSKYKLVYPFQWLW